MISPFSARSKSMNVSESVKFFLKNKNLTGVRQKVFDKSKDNFLHDFFVSYTSELLKKSFTKDYLIINQIRLVEELDEVINRLFERLFELFGLYFPEASYKLNSPESFYKTLKKGVSRDVISRDLKINKNSIGMNLSSVELKVLQNNVFEFVHLFDLREVNKKQVEVLAKDLMPNTFEVAGGYLTAKLLSEAGSFRALAMMPSSTIQIIGAEKALFKHLTTGSKSPKHGVILQHVLMQRVKRSHRGKLARILSGKINLAVKADYFSPKDLTQGKKLYKKVLSEFNKLR